LLETVNVRVYMKVPVFWNVT